MKGRVAVLGTGFMGSAAARRLASLGFEVYLWNRTFERAVKLANELGGRAFRTAAETVSHVEAALLFLSDDDAVLSVIASLGRVDGLVIVNLSTVTPRASVAAARHLESFGGCYVEAPLIGGPRVVERGEAIAIVAGPEKCVEPGEKYVKAIASRIFRVGVNYGSAAALKLAFNNMLLASLVSLVESIMLLKAYGVDPNVFRDVLKSTFLAGIADRFYERVTQDRVDTTFRAKLAAKDSRYISQAAKEAGSLPLLSQKIEEIYNLMDYSGWGDEDYTSLLRFLRRLKAH